MADSAALDAAVISLLLNDTTLQGLLPDGVYFDFAAPGAQRYTLVTITAAPDTSMFGSRACEGPVYLVLAVVLSVTGGNIQAAAARIDALLDGATVSATGYKPATLRRLSRVRHSDPDSADASHRWQTRGGEYELWAAAI